MRPWEAPAEATREGSSCKNLFVTARKTQGEAAPWRGQAVGLPLSLLVMEKRRVPALRPAPGAHPSLRGHPSFCKTHKGDPSALSSNRVWWQPRFCGGGWRGEKVHQGLLLPSCLEQGSEGCRTYPGGQRGPAARASDTLEWFFPSTQNSLENQSVNIGMHEDVSMSHCSPNKHKETLSELTVYFSRLGRQSDT